MLDTTQDILFLVLSICILLLSGFLTWVLFYLGSILRQSNEMITEFRQKMEELAETIDDLKERVIASASSITFIAKEIGQIMNFVKGVKKSRSSNGSKKSKK